MIYKKIVFFLDICFFFFLGFILSLPLFNYLVAYPYNLICAIFIGVIFSLLLGKVLSKKNTKNSIKKKDDLLFKTSLLSLNLMSKPELFGFIREYLTQKGVEFTENRTFFLIPEKKTCLFIKFSFSEVQKVDVVRYYNLIPDGYSATVIGEKFDEEVIAFAKRFNGKFIMVDFKRFFYELKSCGVFPKTRYVLSDEEKPKINLTNLLKKKNAKRFFSFGVIMFFLAFFVQIKTYYIVVGSVFFLWTLVLILFGSEEIKDA